MADRGDGEGFGLTPTELNGARQKDSYYLLSDDNTSVLKETEAEYKKVKSDFLRIARNNRRHSELTRSESSRSLSPVHRRSSRRSRNIRKFKIATFYPTDVELWFNQIIFDLCRPFRRGGIGCKSNIVTTFSHSQVHLHQRSID